VSEISITQFKNGINNSEKRNTNNSIRDEREKERKDFSLVARHEEFISREERRRIKIRLHPIMWKTL
jgi:hypothetical protein